MAKQILRLLTRHSHHLFPAQSLSRQVAQQRVPALRISSKTCGAREHQLSTLEFRVLGRVCHSFTIVAIPPDGIVGEVVVVASRRSLLTNEEG